MHGKAGSMIPFLRKIPGKIGNPWDKGRRTKKYDDIKSFLEVKITRYNSNKQERKAIDVYYQHSNFWEKKDTMKK
jgi:hypothetical protein